VIRRALAVTVLALMVAVPAASAQGTAFTISAKGSKRSVGSVTAVGNFKPTVDASLEAAQNVFGKPSSVGTTGNSCQAGWRNLGLRILFANFGGGDDACGLGKAQTVSAFGKSWRTSRGLQVGAPVKTLRKLYPGAVRKGRTYRLVGARTFDGSPYSVVAAKTNGNKVTSFKLFVGAAGE
jgi:hypothetical protein